jgi:hypothetical protein
MLMASFLTLSDTEGVYNSRNIAKAAVLVAGFMAMTVFVSLCDCYNVVNNGHANGPWCMVMVV